MHVMKADLWYQIVQGPSLVVHLSEDCINSTVMKMDALNIACAHCISICMDVQEDWLFTC